MWPKHTTPAAHTAHTAHTNDKQSNAEASQASPPFHLHKKPHILGRKT